MNTESGRHTPCKKAYTIERKPKDYYDALERNNKDLEITDWVQYFSRTVLSAQVNTIRRVDFYVTKAKFYEGMHDKFNERQAKVIARMFKGGIDGYKGGLSAENYLSIAITSRATATRDLQDLVEKGGAHSHGRAAAHAVFPAGAEGDMKNNQRIPCLKRCSMMPDYAECFQPAELRI
jgi:Fic family protein